MALPEPRSYEADPESVYRVIGQFFRSLVDAGVEHVCVSPGSRSTPLCVSANETDGLRTWVGLDERATSFFALGIAKTTARPVALVCTSGTAAANYLPAIIEAHYSGVPLLVLTADRPPELRDWGAGQTIDQVGLYGGYCRWAVDVPPPAPGPEALRYATQLAARAVDSSVQRTPGPVHLNWPLREPLPPPPNFFGLNPSASQSPRTPKFSQAVSVADPADVLALTERVTSLARGVLCIGPLAPRNHRAEEDAFAQAVAAFSREAGWPIFADPASGLRGNPAFEDAPLICAGDGILRSADFSSRMKPEMVLRIGESPVSKSQRLWLEAVEPPHVWWFDEGTSWGEPSHRATRVIRGGAASLLRAVVDRLSAQESPGAGGLKARRTSSWCAAFETAEHAARAALASFAKGQPDALSGVSVATTVAAHYAEDGLLFASNSMSIRLLDLAQGASKGLRVLANRGASGIDGITSTALGVAAAARAPTVLLTGDLALLHDLSGLLLAKQESIDLVIVVLDDDGGGIFSFLPIAAQGEGVSFEKLFGTPQNIEFERVASLFDLQYDRVTSTAELVSALDRGKARRGVSLVHVPLDRKNNEAAYRRALSEIAVAVEGTLPG